MGGTTVLPPSLLPRRSAAASADLHSCSSRVRVNPALMANPAAAMKPKRPGSVRGEQLPPAKRVRGACSGGQLHVAVPANIKNGSKLPSPSSGKDPLHSSAIKNQVAESPDSSTQSKPPISIRQLIENARLVMDWAHPAAEEEASRRRHIERSRAEARRKVERMADTVQFNDPWIHYSDVTKSPEELLKARQHAWRYQAHLPRWLVDGTLLKRCKSTVERSGDRSRGRNHQQCRLAGGSLASEEAKQRKQRNH
ncbi:unnamed protein product [Triticum turgidum subsp. durum]|uniref:Uncharacterized protein n=1 Tax=Triticum turgidum subsp. durum TaxID=4567 RepID=A0A9R0ZMC3_TRITD|nr:unnamed protein product [Triticum turgidum subsp. durum]